MLSWKTIRIISLVLLLIPVIHLVYLVSQDTLATMNNSTDAWASEIAAYARRDRVGELPENPIVVVGGRRVKLWRDLEDALAPKPVLMRGVGDATVEDILANHEKLIGHYRPQTLILLPSNSEFHLRANNSAEDLVEDIRNLAQVDNTRQLTHHFYVIPPLKTPLYPADYEKIDETTRQLEAWAARQPRVTVLDANRVLQDRDEKPHPNYYRPDGVHLNEHGYVRLTALVEQQVQKDHSSAG